jgi:hypothetical protein
MAPYSVIPCPASSLMKLFSASFMSYLLVWKAWLFAQNQLLELACFQISTVTFKSIVTADTSTCYPSHNFSL